MPTSPEWNETNCGKNLIATLYQIVQDDREIKQTKRDKINESIELEEYVPVKKQQCNVCKYECEKEIPLKKHKNTKHMNVNQKERDGDDQVTTKTKSPRFTATNMITPVKQEEHPNCECTADSIFDECIKDLITKAHKTS